MRWFGDGWKNDEIDQLYDEGLTTSDQARRHEIYNRIQTIIAEEAGTPAKEFCPGRRLDAFDQYWSHKQKQKLVVANFTVRPESLPDDVQAGKVYVLDGRDRDPTAMEVAVADLDAQFESAGLRVAPLGELR